MARGEEGTDGDGRVSSPDPLARQAVAAGRAGRPGRNSRSGQNNSSPGGINYFPLNWARPRSPPTAPLGDGPLNQRIGCGSKGLGAARENLLLWVSKEPAGLPETSSRLSTNTWGLPLCSFTPSPSFFQCLPLSRQSPKPANTHTLSVGLFLPLAEKGTTPPRALASLWTFSKGSRGPHGAVAPSIAPAGPAQGSLPLPAGQV